ncbi:helix-turn-helix transcriptional regulator [Amycolatopsis antarctica]|nr:LuxR C-terminal-related transcriptional regulator [Amycolatopsis antarctica]
MSADTLHERPLPRHDAGTQREATMKMLSAGLISTDERNDRDLPELVPGRFKITLTVAAGSVADAVTAQALRAGSSAGDTVFDIGAAVHAAARRELFVSPTLLRRFDRTIVGLLVAHTTNANLLTKSEKRIVTLIATGMSNVAMARSLHVSPATVSTHISNILPKLKVANRTAAARTVLGRSREHT